MKSFQPEYSLQLLALQLDEYESYLLSKELYWPLSHRAPSGSRPFLRLTTGNLMLNINEITVYLDLLNPSQEQQYFQLILSWDSIRQKWRGTIQEKALLELKNRIKLWSAYLEDLIQGKDRGQSYSFEVRFRLICSLLLDLLTDREEFVDLQKQIRLLDQQLKTQFEPGPFLWPDRLRDMYPADLYWFLYGKPADKDQVEEP
ncbi:MAG: hypothetical protein JXA25_12235 [Anaerolineales bacterium]|nr:hypothetical protein [Anaerolineales bacterium]